MKGLPRFSGNPLSDPNLKSALALFLPATFTLGVTQINLLVNTKFALDMGEGPNSYLFYANRLAELPLGIFGIAIATAAFPRFSTSAL
ncbi:MAG: murein biosynthesis integral membrane protein MurJ, partial [Candidatus Omnitrophica bacterium]|nr:murein biosynthesis integral membrane protein MurJ [Candidatus Omnitrophota bacterium]